MIEKEVKTRWLIKKYNMPVYGTLDFLFETMQKMRIERKAMVLSSPVYNKDTRRLYHAEVRQVKQDIWPHV